MNINAILSHAFYYGGIIIHVAGTLALMLLIGIMPWMPGWVSIILILLVVIFTMLNILALHKYFTQYKRVTRDFTVCPIENSE